MFTFLSEKFSQLAGDTSSSEEEEDDDDEMLLPPPQRSQSHPAAGGQPQQAQEQPPPVVIQQHQRRRPADAPKDRSVDMGCWMFSDSQEPSTRKQVNTLFGEVGNSLTTSGTPNLMAKTLKYDTGKNGATGGSMTARWADYTDMSTYNVTPQLDSEYRKSTGVMVNAYTGKMYETFEEDMPPPNTDKWIPPEQFKKSNPRLVMLQGSNDLNAPRRKKREVCQKVPDDSAGPNVWGDQLYADRRRQEMQTRLSRDVWSNRNGIYSVEAYDDRKPVGYVGYVNTLRPVPFLPATQRADLDNHDYKGIEDSNLKSGVAWDTIQPWVSTSKPVYDESMTRYQGPDATNPAAADYTIMPDAAVNIPGTNRSVLYTNPQPGGAINPTASYYATHEMSASEINELRPTQKGLMDSVAYGMANAGGGSGAGSVVVVNGDVRETQKGLMASAFPVTSVTSDLTSLAGCTVISDVELKPTQKGLMAAGAFPITSFSTSATGGIAIIDTDLKETQKGLMAGAFPVTSIASDLTSLAGCTVISDTNLKDTLKGLMGSQAFAAGNANVDSAGALIDYARGEEIGTKRMYYEQDMPTGGVAFASDPAPFIGARSITGTLSDHVTARGGDQQSWVSYSQIPQSGGDTTNVNSVMTYMVKPTERGNTKVPFATGMGTGSVYHDNGVPGGAILTARMFREDIPSPQRVPRKNKAADSLRSFCNEDLTVTPGLHTNAIDSIAKFWS